MRVLALFLSFIFTMQSLPLAYASEVSETDRIIVSLTNLTHNFDKGCVPKLKTSYTSYLKTHGMSEACWKLITEINYQEARLSALHPQLANKVNCATGNCLKGTKPIVNLPSLSPIAPACTQADKNRISTNCHKDMACTLVSSVSTLPLTNLKLLSPQKLLPRGMSPRSCSANDSCINQVVTSFFNSIMKFFNNAWDMLKIAGEMAKDKLGDFWTWVSSAEDSSSAAQLALAKASEDDGLFQSLKNDFAGTVSRVFQALVASTKLWLKEDIFCEKWASKPHLSKCVRPAQGFDCLSCKSVLNGICAIGGVFISEVLPAFISGGLTTAAKHGVGAASRIVQSSFKFSDKTIKSIKNSKTIKASLKIAGHSDKTAKVGIVLSKINKYFISPARKVAKSSFTIVSALARNSKSYLAQTTSGKYIVFAQDGLKLAGKVALYPIENNMTLLSFKAGQQTFDKAFKLAVPSLANKTSVAMVVTAHTPALDAILTKIEIGHIKKSKTLALELEQVKILQGIRPALTRKALAAKKPQFSEIIRTLYPELDYGQLAKKLSAKDLLLREKELYLHLARIKDPVLKKSMLAKYQGLITDSKQRRNILKDTPNYKEIVDNSQLSSVTKGARGLKILNKHPNDLQRKKLEAAIRTASSSPASKKKKILMDAGFSEAEAQKLINYGITGLAAN